jgi:ribosomal protein S18 acetylase RimI-like enzyme
MFKFPQPNDNKLLVRSATQNDLSAACEVDYEAFSPYGTAELSSVIEARWAAFPKGFIVAERHSRIIGYGTSEKWANVREPAMNEDPHLTHVPTGRIFCITAMAVRKDSRNEGVGLALLNRFEEIARQEKCVKIILETTHAQGFYIKRGFYLYGKRKQMNADLEILCYDLSSFL